MPLIPLTAVDDLPNMLSSFCSQLSTPPPSLSNPVPAALPTQVLLPHCAVGTPLSPSTTNVLSDINSGFSDLLDKITKPEG